MHWSRVHRAEDLLQYEEITQEDVWDRCYGEEYMLDRLVARNEGEFEHTVANEI